MARQLSSTMENYLECVFRIEKEKHFARVRDIADALNVANSTATAALNTLREKGLINYAPYQPVTLTSLGRRTARQIVLRHRTMRDFLENVLDMDRERADSIGCQMEHALDRDALERFLCFLAFMKVHCPNHIDCLGRFRQFLKEGADGKNCRQCVETYLRELERESHDTTGAD